MSSLESEEPGTPGKLEDCCSESASTMQPRRYRERRKDSFDATDLKYEGPVPPAQTIPIDKLLSWDFDIFEYEDRTSTAFKDICYNVVKLFDVDKTLKAEDQTVLDWLDLVRRSYDKRVPYHNSLHAADVTQATAIFLSSKEMKTVLSDADRAVLVIAAIAHDIHHPGLVSTALTNLNHRICEKCEKPYLETHHVLTTFDVSVKIDECNIFKNLDEEKFTLYKKQISDLIYATDMSQHEEHFREFNNDFTAAKPPGKPVDLTLLNNPDTIKKIKKILLKSADISASQRPLPIHIRWTERICEEFYRQTRIELDAKLKPTYPEYEHQLCVIPKVQLQFLYLIAPMVDTWDDFLGLGELNNHFYHTLKFWKKFEGEATCSFEQVREASKNEV